ncbi:MAG: hypothetical protein NTU55_00395 [Actinobacteria bacterium]|nr:hypothetical protein [Actinomycetota bacterium]
MKMKAKLLVMLLAILGTFIVVPAQAVTALPLDPRVGDRCEKDPKVPKAWKEYQDITWNYPACPHPYRYVSGKLTSKIPKTVQNNRSELLSVDQCMISNFWATKRAEQARGEILGPNYTLQLVPFQSPDYKMKSNPQDDYKVWIKAFEDVMNKSSDLPFNFKVVVPDKYFMLPNTLKSYEIGYKYWEDYPDPRDKVVQPGVMRLVQDVVTAADPQIDFSKANHMWIIGPPTANRKDLISWDLYKYTIQTQEKLMKRLYLAQNPFDYKFDLKNRSQNDKKYGKMKSNYIFDGSGALGWSHYWGHSSGTFTTFASVQGYPDQMMDWGIMQKKDSDWLALHKWILQMISDDQVRCAPKDKVTTHWLKPSTIKGGYEKLLMVPISSSDYLAVESIRPYGYSYKIPKCQQGALVYVAHLYGQGFNEKTIHVPATTKKKGCPGRGPSELGALVKGDSVSYGGVRITVVEAGDFGDVIKVEPGA